MEKYVVGFIFDDTQSHVLLCRKIRPRWQRDRWNGIGGHIEKRADGVSDECAIDAMARECKEEIGREYDWRLVTVLKGDLFEIHVFYALGTRATIMSKVNEPTLWFSLDELPENVLPNIRWLIEMAKSLSRGESADHFVVQERTQEHFEG